MDRIGHMNDQPRGFWRAQQRHASRAGATYGRFVAALKARGDYTDEDADAFALAVIATLEEKLPFAAVANLEAQLPSILHDALEHEPIHDLPMMDKVLFCKRVAARLNVTIEKAEAVTRVVFSVLRGFVSAGESRRVEQQLLGDLRDLWVAETLDH